jgi:sugar lactone lactonase YvrE
VIELRAEVVLDAQAALGEGPVWDEGRRVLWWLDIPRGHVHAFDPRRGKDKLFNAGSVVGAVALRTDGTLLLAAKDSFTTLDPATGLVETILRLPSEGNARRANDGKCDPVGRFLIGRMPLDGAEGAGALYRLDPDMTLALVLGGLTVPNGLAWRADGRVMYYIDSARQEVTAYPYDLSAGTLGTGRPVVRFRGDAVPDGMTIDAEGCLWVALWGGSRVVRISPAGEMLATVHVPASLVSSCTFGSEYLDELYITTAREGLKPDDDAREPLAGSLFRARPGPKGLPSVNFAG